MKAKHSSQLADMPRPDPKYRAPMVRRVRRVLRAVLAASVTLAVWVVAAPAWAAPAPYCDDRGASALAAPPMLGGTDPGVLAAPAKVECPGDDGYAGATLTRAHAEASVSVDSPEAPIATAPPPVVHASGEALPPPPSVVRPPDGVRSRVERPPRV
jgi:hypothetical protein